MFRKLILFPFTAVYALALYARHFAYDCGILKSELAALPTLVLGNIHLGGTGKTPHASAFLQLFSEKLGGPEYVALLSRGYKRSTKGFALVNLKENWTEFGDEPTLLKSMHPLNPIAVCEDRLSGVEEIKRQHPQVKLVILDDGLQHRSLRPHKSLLLIDARRPLKKECLFPSGNLRDLKTRSERFDAWIISRDSMADEKEVQKSTTRVRPVFSSRMLSGTSIHTPEGAVLKNIRPSVLVVCGIAQPHNFIDELQKDWEVISIKTYSDHHRFSEKQVEEWVGIMKDHELDAIITTCKDAVRIYPLITTYPHITLVSIPIKVEWTDKDAINNWVDKWLESPIFAIQNKNNEHT